MLTDEQYEQVLNFFPKEINTEFRTYLKEKTQVIFLSKGATLINSFSPQENIYVILSGSCIRYIINDKGDERAIMFHTEEFMRILGDIYIKQTNSAVKYFVRMNEASFLLKIDLASFKPIALSCLPYVLFGTQLSIDNLSIQNQFQNHLIGLSKEAFLEWLLKNYNFLFQRFRAKDIAHFIGVSPTWLSLLKTKLLKRKF